jgi:hypothetical protein
VWCGCAIIVAQVRQPFKQHVVFSVLVYRDREEFRGRDWRDG